jgi:hypothetical protein
MCSQVNRLNKNSKATPIPSYKPGLPLFATGPSRDKHLEVGQSPRRSMPHHMLINSNRSHDPLEKGLPPIKRWPCRNLLPGSQKETGTCLAEFTLRILYQWPFGSYEIRLMGSTRLLFDPPRLG